MSIGNESFNYTYNVSLMWYACYPGKGIRKHYGLSGDESLPVLRGLREYMENNYKTLVEMEPDNGWGSYEGALQFVSNLIFAAIKNPDEIWEGD